MSLMYSRSLATSDWFRTHLAGSRPDRPAPAAPPAPVLAPGVARAGLNQTGADPRRAVAHWPGRRKEKSIPPWANNPGGMPEGHDEYFAWRFRWPIPL